MPPRSYLEKPLWLGFPLRMTMTAQTSREAPPPTSRPLPMALVTWAFICLVLILVVALVVVKLTQGPTTVAGTPAATAPSAVVSAVAGLPEADFEAAGGAPPAPGPALTNGPAIEAGGRPEVVFVGAEFSPYSAAASWAVVASLSRFGSFSRLGAASSSAQEVFPRTPGLSFAGALYHSDHVSLSAVERYGDALSAMAPAGYPALGTPSSSVETLVRRYAATSDGGPALPFVDVAGRVISVGSGIGFSPGLLQGQSMEQVAGALGDPGSSEGAPVLAVANELTAAVCAADGDQPESVCRSAAVRDGAGGLGLP
jgi:Domain of unknown function (DUF929)